MRQLVENDKRELRRLGKLADKVIALESQMSALEDADFPVKTEEYKARYAQGESLDALLPEAFALVREGAKRVLGLFPYKVSNHGWITLHDGNIAGNAYCEGKR